MIFCAEDNIYFGFSMNFFKLEWLIINKMLWCVVFESMCLNISKISWKIYYGHDIILWSVISMFFFFSEFMVTINC